MSDLSGKLEFVQEIKSPGHVFFEIYGSKKDDLPKLCPDKIPLIELVEGDWGNMGCILLVHYSIARNKICPDKVPSIELLEGNWGEVGCKLLVNYLIDGKLIPVKETIEAADEDNMSMTYRILEGDLVKDYKSLLITVQATLKGKKNFLNWIYEYEKQNLDVPAPDHMFDFASEVSNIIDTYYLKNQDHFQA